MTESISNLLKYINLSQEAEQTPKKDKPKEMYVQTTDYERHSKNLKAPRFITIGDQ